MIPLFSALWMTLAAVFSPPAQGHALATDIVLSALGPQQDAQMHDRFVQIMEKINSISDAEIDQYPITTSESNTNILRNLLHNPNVCAQVSMESVVNGANNTTPMINAFMVSFFEAQEKFNPDKTGKGENEWAISQEMIYSYKFIGLIFKCQ